MNRPAASCKLPRVPGIASPPDNSNVSGGGDLWLGRTVLSQRTMGFASQGPPKQSPFHSAGIAGNLLRDDSESHLITVAPTSSGKGLSAVIPNLLHYSGACIVLDVKGGELTRITARRRREFGPVHVIDPFCVTGQPSACLSPMDLFAFPGAEPELEAEFLADLFARELSGLKDPFWDQNAKALLSAVLSFVGTRPPDERKLSRVIDHLLADDTVYNLALLLDKMGKTMPRMAYREIAAFLQMPEITRGGVLATALSYLKTLHSPRVLGVLDSTTIPLADLIAGVPMTIYLVLPVERLHSHAAMLKLCIGTLLKAILSRQHRAIPPTLLMLDECGQLAFPFLESFITLCRAYSCRVWTFWQDLAQLQSCFAGRWKTIVNNCCIIQAFGFGNRDLAKQWGDYLEASPSELLRLGRDEAIVQRLGQRECRVQKLNYLRDPEFAGLYDDNPLYR